MFCKLLHACCFINRGIPHSVLLLLTEQINLILFYYIQDVYQKNQLGSRLDKRIRGYDTGEKRGGSKHFFWTTIKTTFFPVNY